MSKMISNRFYCLKCANKNFSIPRKQSDKRKHGHFKKMFCLTCKEEINHLEVREFEVDFDYERFQWDVANGKYDEFNKGVDRK